MSSYEDSDVEITEELGVEQFEENAEQTEETPAENNEAEAAPSKPVKAKRVIRNPQPKLNAERLKGPRGLAALESHFDRVKYKGKGYEEQDLGVILKTYEYWCHRLFPKYPFDECIAKIEALGSKKPVVTHIKRIRYDLLVEDPPIINNDDSDPEPEAPAESQFDAVAGLPGITQPNDEPELTEEQLEMIKINRERAARIRKERMTRGINESQGSEIVATTASEGNDLPMASQDEFPDDLEMEEIGQSVDALPMPSEDDFPSDQEEELTRQEPIISSAENAHPTQDDLFEKENEQNFEENSSQSQVGSQPASENLLEDQDLNEPETA
ncbi:TIMELESS-interacting protein-like Protein [Tribolium castaneum]|uniref:TIMELESS-interacting protein n=2 Tax=Tribolium castaneum TaxID=7070 RepID=D6WT39_TRICA|nr:PREDICTED: TIMELESS-interacting protein [Tribolium castaneum]XP_008196354.1 PREDICTED: TIMELESS-interacting protein [Tribolium castaneum]EFA05870.2 TIMELESS-interacting protein-like Protein [Tribolium castaneum]|eukprot:XP_008196352.1 PREDICTED: TIMELESS-interacting protein [Tribolium castaneum]